MKTYTADQIARYFLSLTDAEANDVSNLKLQKLVYYAQGVVTAMRDGRLPLIAENVEAWDHGPVVPELYHAYKKHGRDPIPVVTDFDIAQIDEDDRAVLNDVHSYYAQFSPWRLRNMTHEERPWIEAYASGRVIPVETMVEFFRPQINDDYARAAYGQGAKVQG